MGKHGIYQFSFGQQGSVKWYQKASMKDGILTCLESQSKEWKEFQAKENSTCKDTEASETTVYF